MEFKINDPETEPLIINLLINVQAQQAALTKLVISQIANTDAEQLELLKQNNQQVEMISNLIKERLFFKIGNLDQEGRS